MTLVSRLAAAALLACAFPALAADPKPPRITLSPEQVHYLCDQGTWTCPLAAPICDNTKVATIEDGGDRGLKVVPHKPGKTLCSVQTADRTRRVFEILVR